MNLREGLALARAALTAPVWLPLLGLALLCVWRAGRLGPFGGMAWAFVGLGLGVLAAAVAGAA